MHGDGFNGERPRAGASKGARESLHESQRRWALSNSGIGSVILSELMGNPTKHEDAEWIAALISKGQWRLVKMRQVSFCE